MSDSQKPPREIWVTKSGTDPIVKGLAYIHYSAQPNTTNFINKQLYDLLMQQALAMHKGLALALSFAPKGMPEEGLAPMFYHTLNFADEVKLQNRIDEARKALEQFDEFIGEMK